MKTKCMLESQSNNSAIRPGTFSTNLTSFLKCLAHAAPSPVVFGKKFWHWRAIALSRPHWEWATWSPRSRMLLKLPLMPRKPKSRERMDSSLCFMRKGDRHSVYQKVSTWDDNLSQKQWLQLRILFKMFSKSQWNLDFGILVGKTDNVTLGALQ